MSAPPPPLRFQPPPGAPPPLSAALPPAGPPAAGPPSAGAAAPPIPQWDLPALPALPALPDLPALPSFPALPNDLASILGNVSAPPPALGPPAAGRPAGPPAGPPPPLSAAPPGPPPALNGVVPQQAADSHKRLSGSSTYTFSPPPPTAGSALPPPPAGAPPPSPQHAAPPPSLTGTTPPPPNANGSTSTPPVARQRRSTSNAADSDAQPAAPSGKAAKFFGEGGAPPAAAARTQRSQSFSAKGSGSLVRHSKAAILAAYRDSAPAGGSGERGDAAYESDAEGAEKGAPGYGGGGSDDEAEKKAQMSLQFQQLPPGVVWQGHMALKSGLLGRFSEFWWRLLPDALEQYAHATEKKALAVFPLTTIRTVVGAAPGSSEKERRSNAKRFDIVFTVGDKKMALKTATRYECDQWKQQLNDLSFKNKQEADWQLQREANKKARKEERAAQRRLHPRNPQIQILMEEATLPLGMCYRVQDNEVVNAAAGGAADLLSPRSQANGVVMSPRSASASAVYLMHVVNRADVFADDAKELYEDMSIINHKYHLKQAWWGETESTLYALYSPPVDVTHSLYFQLLQKRRLPENVVRLVAAQLVSLLDYLHSINTPARNLCPENLYFDSAGNILGGDLLMALPFGATEDLPQVRVPEYLSPEFYFGPGETLKSDWWRLGVLLYEMVVGLPPYRANANAPVAAVRNVNAGVSKATDEEKESRQRELSENHRARLVAIREEIARADEQQLKFPPFVSAEMKDFLSRLLTREPHKRITLTEIKKHNWFEPLADVKWDDIESALFVPPSLAANAGSPEAEAKRQRAQKLADYLNAARTWMFENLNLFGKAAPVQPPVAEPPAASTPESSAGGANGSKPAATKSAGSASKSSALLKKKNTAKYKTMSASDMKAALAAGPSTMDIMNNLTSVAGPPQQKHGSLSTDDIGSRSFAPPMKQNAASAPTTPAPGAAAPTAAFSSASSSGNADELRLELDTLKVELNESQQRERNERRERLRLQAENAKLQARVAELEQLLKSK